MKIGIISPYYKSVNYGGNLQAYALCKVINSRVENVHAEQVCYANVGYYEKPAHPVYYAKRFLRKYYRKMKRVPLLIKNAGISGNLKQRTKAFARFNQEVIPNSRTSYTRQTIKQVLDRYDAFVTGSDQVWNPIMYDAIYRLDFVPGGKPKIAYAASVCQDTLTQGQHSIFEKTLKDYLAVSVREENTVDLLQPLSPVLVEWVLDPTLLLSRAQWDEICTDRRIGEDYLFCYFLGGDTDMRRLAEEFAEKENLKIVTLPNLLGTARRCDSGFGDEQLYDVSPEDFISLVRYAKYVFTDSFHATVFSLLYEREFCVFQRAGERAMASRIYTLAAIFSLEDRFCSNADRMTTEYIQSLQPIDYTRDFHEFERMKEKSMAYLTDSLNRARMMVEEK